VIEAAARLGTADELTVDDPTAANALCSFVHGYVTLDLADHFR